MPSGEDDAVAARWEPLLVFEELLPGERLLVELNFDEFFFGAFLAGCAFLGCRTLVRFWSSIIDRTQAEPMSIRPRDVMHKGLALRAQTPHQASSEVKVAGNREKMREDKRPVL